MVSTDLEIVGYCGELEKNTGQLNIKESWKAGSVEH
jgi:hypothetical protein